MFNKRELFVFCSFFSSEYGTKSAALAVTFPGAIPLAVWINGH
jgi:hypothetical protein